MKILANHEEATVSVKATIETAGVEADQFVKITGDETVDVAGSGDVPVGYVKVPAKDATEEDAEITVETFFTRKFTAKAVGGALSAGTQVKLGAPSSGQSTVADLSTGDRKLMVGIVWIGGAENAEVTVLGR